MVADDPTRSRIQLHYPGIALAAGVMIVIVTLFHYLTGHHQQYFHDIYRRLYYIPIVLAAYAYGLRGGLIASGATVVLYIPHAFLMHHTDPSPSVNKISEIVIYLLVGGLVGALISRERRLVSQLTRTEQEKRAIERSLDRASRLAALGELTAGLAHEIRNPLASIKGSAEILADDFESDHPKRSMVDILLKETDRLNGVLHRFLSFARPHEANMTTVDLAAQIGEVVELVKKQAEQKGCVLEFSKPDRPALLHADLEQLRQLALNLVLNAIKAAGENGRVVVSIKHADAEIHLDVTDSGPGIPEADRERIFDPFYTTREGGTGLGLAICTRIATDHNARIDVSDAPGGGSTFNVIFSGEA